MNTIRERNEAEKAAVDYTCETWVRAKGRSGDHQGALEAALEAHQSLLTELAKASPFVKSVLEERVKTLRGKRGAPREAA